MGLIGELASLVLRLFCLGLFLSVLLDLFRPGPPGPLRSGMTRFYDRFLNPLRRWIPPIPLSSSTIDPSPLILILFIWLCLEPFLEWVFRG